MRIPVGRVVLTSAQSAPPPLDPPLTRKRVYRIDEEKYYIIEINAQQFCETNATRFARNLKLKPNI